MKKIIIATIGPSSMNQKVIQKMDSFGVDLFRINLSHTDINDFESTIKKVQNWTTKPVCPDTEGAQLRTGFIKESPLHIKTHDAIVFVGSNSNRSKKQIPLSVSNIVNLLQPCDLMKIDFDSVVVQLTNVGNSYATGRIISGGFIGSNKGISVDRGIKLPGFTQKDIEAFEISRKLNLKTIFLSFCSNAHDVRKLREYFDYDIDVISKIESKSGMENIVEICEESDGILIDRGDLSRDVPLEKIAFAQKYIINKARSINTPVYVATNLMESMIENSKPTRAEVNDIVSLLEHGAKGLVLAAESAIGKNPVDCVRIMSQIINEVEDSNHNESIDNLFSLVSNNIIRPHGGSLIQQHAPVISDKELTRMTSLVIDEKSESDVIQICEGTFSPLDSFMNFEELMSVLENNKLSNGSIWTLPILLLINQAQAKRLPQKGQILLKSKKSGKDLALLMIESVQKLDLSNNLVKKWFGTIDKKHPGVSQLYNGCEYIVSGKPFLFHGSERINMGLFNLTPKQTREIFHQKGWNEIIGFSNRDVCHRGHEFIQKKALDQTNADAIFILPVKGLNNKNDFTDKIILNCYQELIRKGLYDPYGVLLGSFNTYERYCGYREVIFRAICNKNYGCNYFIFSREHNYVDNFSNQNESIDIFSQMNIDMQILKFEPATYSDVSNEITEKFNNQKMIKLSSPISGASVKDCLAKGHKIPEYLMRKEISKVISEEYMINKCNVLEI